VRTLARITAALATAAALAPGAARALDLRDRLAVGAQAGTTGPGVEGLVQLNDRLVLRGAIEGFRADGRIRAGGGSYDAEARWLTDSGMADLHPTGSPWLVSLGVYYGRRDLKLRGAAEGLGAVDGRARLSGFAPFAAVGWDNTFHGARRWGVKARAGVIFSGAPDVDLRATGGGASPQAEAALRAAEAAVRDELKPARAWPVVQVGLNRRF